MTACSKCASLGKPVEEKPVPRRVIPRPQPIALPSAPRSVRKDWKAALPSAIEQLELDEDYSEIIKDGRAKANLSQEELARIVKEKLSMIQKIESRKVIPNMKLAKAIEHVLRVKLLVPPSEIPVPASRQKPTPEVTLADVARIKAKDKNAIPI